MQKVNLLGIISLVITASLVGGSAVSKVVKTESLGEVNTRDIQELKETVNDTNHKIDDQDRKMNQLITDMVVLKQALGVNKSPLVYSKQ